MFRIAPLSLAAAVAVALVALASTRAAANDPSPPHSLGDCGGTMVGQDGQQYACGPDRKPACNEQGARCVCLEQRDCGGTRDEPY